MVYIKDFLAWAHKKVVLDATPSIPYFREREIWYCSMGHNIGYEQDGKGPDYSRPVLIIKKYNKYLFTGIPLTTKTKSFPFYFSIGKVNDKDANAILSQTRAYSSKRLINKVETLDNTTFEATKKAASTYIFGS